MDHGHGGAVELLDRAPAPAQWPAERPSEQEQNGRDGQGDESQLPIHSRDHIDHSDQRDGGIDQREEAAERHCLDAVGVVLNPVGGVARTLVIVVGERKTLHLTEQFRAKILKQLLAGIRLQHSAQCPLQLAQQRDQQQCRNDE